MHRTESNLYSTQLVFSMLEAGHGSATHTCGVDCTSRSVHVCQYQSSGTSTRVLVGRITQDTLAQTYTDLTPVLLGSHKIHLTTVASILAEAVSRARAGNPHSACWHDHSIATPATKDHQRGSEGAAQ